MKYIRTKDGRIIGFEPKTKDLDLIKYLSQFVNYQGENTPVKQADTIEELCDCFAVIRPQPRGTDHYILHRFAFVKEHCLNGDEMVYGAIWTDKGLTYVAKMNDKGELELL